jgi:hypothetical protein
MQKTHGVFNGLDGSAELLLSRWTEIQMGLMTRRVAYKIQN